MADVKQTLEERQPNSPFGAFDLSRRTIGSRTSFVSVKYFHYNKQNFGVPSSVNPGQFTNEQKYGVSVGILEEEIASLKISKNISQPSGTFEIKLHPVQNWKQKISPGDWVAIYIYDRYQVRDQPGKGDDSKNLVMLGNVDRISRSLQKDEQSDKVQLTFSISGRSFGKALEETDIWYDPGASQEKPLDIALQTAGLVLQGNPTTLVKAVFDIFLGRGGFVKTGKTTPLNQWRIPNEVARLFKTNTDPQGAPLIYDIIKPQFKPGLPGFKARNMLSLDSNGSVWNMLERSSNTLVNEIFLEEVRDGDGRAFPTLVLRPRPLQTPFLTSHFEGLEGMISNLKGAHQSLQDLSKKSFVEISPSEIIYEDLGKDDHSRLNMFWMRVQQSYEFAYGSTANLKVALGNPTFNRDSIARYGLKRFDQILDFSFATGTTEKGEPMAIKAPTPNIHLFQAFMGQLYDMNFANHLYDAGTITCTGVLEAELGKALVIPKDPKIEKSLDKVYYIEGYTHEWTFPNMWRTTFMVTHGQFRGTENIFIDALEGPAGSGGDYGTPDATIQTAYLSKTKTERK